MRNAGKIQDPERTDLKILMLAPQPFFQPRGTPLSVFQRLRALSALGHETDLVTYHLGADVQLPGLRIHRIPPVPLIDEVRVGPSLKKVLLDAMVFITALRLILTRRYDYIHSHEEAAFCAMALSFLFGVPHVYDMHSSLPCQLKSFDCGNWFPVIQLFKLLEKLAIRSSRVVITIDSSLENYVRSIHRNAHVTTIENLPLDPGLWGVNHDDVPRLRSRLQLHEARPVVYTGTLEQYQGVELVMESARIVASKEPNARFLMVGGSESQVAHWRKAARRMNLEDCVRFIGMVPPEEALAYLQLADVLVSPRTNGTSVPLKIYTYLCAGKATVATRVASHLQVLDSEIAYLVDPTGEALAEGILALLGDSALREGLGERAQAFARNRCDYPGYLDKVKQVYDSRIADARAAPRAAGPGPAE